MNGSRAAVVSGALTHRENQPDITVTPNGKLTVSHHVVLAKNIELESDQASESAQYGGQYPHVAIDI